MTTLAIQLQSVEPAVELNLSDGRTETVDLFKELRPEQREQLARDAWTIGLRAISNAYSVAQESRLGEIGQDLMKNLEHSLGHRLEQQQAKVDETLRRFFDPTDGKVYERLTHFIGDEGVLKRHLEECLKPDNGLLAQTLATQVGEHSPLLKKLSPTDSEGLVKTLETQLQQVMEENQKSFGVALDPSVNGSAISCFLEQLKKELNNSSSALDQKLATALAALDGNDENSLISRLSRDTHKAQADLLRAMNPDAPDSPIAQLQSGLKRVLNEHAQIQKELLETSRERQQSFETEVKQALTRLETRRDADESSTRGGFEFEDDVCEHVRAVTAGMACIVSPTGNTTGALKGRKVGDVVIEFTEESAFAGNRVVIEAKRAENYTQDKALAEIKEARENRKADVGVFVLASSRAKESFPLLSRVGADVLVQWNDKDSNSDAYFKAAIILALGLVARARAPQAEGQIDALEGLGDRIENEIDRTDKMKGFVDNIQRDAGKIAIELQRGRDKLNLLVRNAESTLQALGVNMLEKELHEEEPLVFATDVAQSRNRTSPYVEGANGSDSTGIVANRLASIENNDTDVESNISTSTPDSPVHESRPPAPLTPRDASNDEKNTPPRPGLEDLIGKRR